MEIEGPDTGGSLDPANGWEGWYVAKAGIYETLFAYDNDMILQPKLATGYTLLNDTTWEITLRKGVTFHDGTTFNADSVLYSFDRVLNESNKRAYEYAFIKDVRKIDDYTIVIETNDKYAPLITSLVDPLMSIVSPNIVDVDKQPIGTGPFVGSRLPPVSGPSISTRRSTFSPESDDWTHQATHTAARRRAAIPINNNFF